MASADTALQSVPSIAPTLSALTWPPSRCRHHHPTQAEHKEHRSLPFGSPSWLLRQETSGTPRNGWDMDLNSRELFLLQVQEKLCQLCCDSVSIKPGP